MRFQKALDDAIDKMRKAAIGHRTALRRAAYKFSPDKTLSRLYAYRLVPNGTRTDGMRAEVVPEEAAVVREVIRGFAEGLTVETIKAKLDARGVLNRSRKRFSKGELVGLVRSTYCSRVNGPLGTHRRSTVYPPLVSVKEWAQAAKNVAKATQNEDFEPLPDTRNDAYQSFLLE